MDLNLVTTEVKNIQVPSIFNRRVKTGVEMVDEYFGQGLLPGQSFTLTARAGCGKTTFTLQMLEAMAKQGYKVGIASCEESIYQLAYTANRLNLTEVEIANMSDVDDIAEAMKDYDIMIVDAFQGLTTKENLNFKTREKYCIETLTKAAKKHECICGIICHLTKMGVIKGGTIVPHAVDMNIKIEPDEEENDLRVFSIEKNRFGSSNEMRVYMGQTGFDFGRRVEVADTGAAPKKNRHQDLWDKIMKIEGEITYKSVLPLVDGDLQKAMTVLREMTLNELIVKEGRGQKALYSLVAVDK